MMGENTQSVAQPQYVKGIGLAVLVLVLLLAATSLVLRFGLDLKVAGLFFSPAEGWRYANDWPWQLLYHYGTIPGLMLTLASLVVFSLGLFRPGWYAWRRSMIVIALTAVLGAGLLVNAILKPYCGRPRPREVVEYQGQWTYCQPCGDSVPGKGMSFPCGHCTMGFLFVSLVFCWQRSKLLAIAGAGFGLVLGSLLGIARAAQGAHFLTDIFWSLGVLLMVSLLSFYIAAPWVERWIAGKRLGVRRHKKWVGLILGVVIVLFTVLFLTRRPFFEIKAISISLPAGVTHLMVVSDVDLVKTDIHYEGQRALIKVLGQGFAFPNAHQDIEFVTRMEDRDLIVDIHVSRQGYFSELQHQLLVTLPLEKKNRISVDVWQPSGAALPQPRQP